MVRGEVIQGVGFGDDMAKSKRTFRTSRFQDDA